MNIILEELSIIEDELRQSLNKLDRIPYYSVGPPQRIRWSITKEKTKNKIKDTLILIQQLKMYYKP